MRLKLLSLVVSVIAVCGAGAALAAHPKVDPATVPTGFLTAHNRISNIPVSSVVKAVRRTRTDVFIEHARLAANEATSFHRHPGPVFVTVVAGTVSNEDVAQGLCRRRTYVKDSGFVERASGSGHRLVAGAAGADYFAVYLLPRRTGPHQTLVQPPRECAS